MKHSTYLLFANTFKIARSISSATDSTFPQSVIVSVWGWFAADFMELATEESTFRSTMLTMYCLNQTKN